MSRREHVAWCKGRALEYLEGVSPSSANAVASMISDMGKNESTASQINGMTIALGSIAYADGPDAVRRWIEGF